MPKNSRDTSREKRHQDIMTETADEHILSLNDVSGATKGNHVVIISVCPGLNNVSVISTLNDIKTVELLRDVLHKKANMS